MTSFRSLRYDQFGGPEVLTLEKREAPALKEGQVQLRVHAAAINPIDWKLRRGTMKWLSGSRFPKRVGADAAGVIEAVGQGATWAVGQRVVGYVDSTYGSMGDVALAASSAVTLLPDNVSFIDAAAGMLLVTAAQALRAAHVNPSDRVLVTGATGGVGLFVLQLAQSRGLRITASTGADGVTAAQRFGATEVLDYKTQRPTGPFAAIIDLGGAYRFAQAQPLLAPRGVLVDPVPTPGRLIGQSLANLVRRQQYRPLMTKPLIADVVAGVEQLASAKVKAVVAKTFSLDQAQEAYRYAEAGGIVGRVVIKP
jgi:NADPH:quinone reductase-like Zn-dependent oxidoreductase